MLTIDVHEPEKAFHILSKSIPCQVASINADRWADYHWQNFEGKDVHVERKTWSELLSSIEKVEDQLRRHIEDKPSARLIFILEGTAVQDISGTCILQSTNRETVWVKGPSSSIRLSQCYAWLYQIQQFMEVFQVPDFNHLCQALVAFYKGDQKEEHSTFNRYFKPITFTPDYRVAQLIGIIPGMGETRAKALIEEFGTVWNVLSAKPTDLQRVAGIGPQLSLELLRKVGRADV